MLDSDIGGQDTREFLRHEAATDKAAGLLEHGRSWSNVRADLVALKENDYDWRAGRIPIYVYHDTDELLTVSREAYALYFTENALGKRAFPSVARMEEDLLRMALALFHAPAESGGSFTSGGTESIFLALKTARDHFKATRSVPGRLNIVIPLTAHPAFDKAAQFLDVDVNRTGLGADLRADLDQMGKAIDSNTVLVACSAPCYPYGVYDQIREIGELALSRGVWLHIDACLGGFLAPFARDEGYAIPDFDFAVPGVTSLSADIHKYGFSAKGASFILYRSASLQAHQGFQFSNWPRGNYSTDTFLGTRPAGAVASAWAVSQYLGRAGYRRITRKIMDAKRRLREGLERIQGLEVLQPSELSILLYKSADSRVDINAVADMLSARGWFVGRSREPEAIHLALNTVHAPIIDEYVRDVAAAVVRVRATGRSGHRDDNTY